MVVDEANLLCWQHSVQSERGGQKALMCRLKDDLGYDVVEEKYVATQIIGDLDFSNRVDLLINDKVIAECKHVTQLNQADQEQLRTYMNHPQLRKDFGVLISFPKKSNPIILPAEAAHRVSHDEAMVAFFGMKTSIQMIPIGPTVNMYSKRHEAIARRMG